MEEDEEGEQVIETAIGNIDTVINGADGEKEVRTDDEEDKKPGSSAPTEQSDSTASIEDSDREADRETENNKTVEGEDSIRPDKESETDEDDLLDELISEFE